MRQKLLKQWEHLRDQRIVMAMSGGVDSSAAAGLLAELGADVVGVFLNVWDYGREQVKGHGSCCATEDAYDARRVADLLGIPFYNVDMREQFKENVIDPFVADYQQGRTPNPCERCNRFVKFGALLNMADELEATFVATGHYVQQTVEEDRVRVFRGHDRAKDQTYFLATTSQQQMARIRFPVGMLQKDETRALARHYGLAVADKLESQDICFIPAGNREAFLRQQGGDAGFQAGAIIDAEGNVLGQHKGIAFYTMGQRRGLDLSNGPWYVKDLRSETAEVVVAHLSDAQINSLSVDSIAWLRQAKVDEPMQVQLRYRSKPVTCHIEKQEDTRLYLRLAQPQLSTAPGQVAAFYHADELLGGGIIQSVS